ncbi:hypothetical protein ACFQW5_06010 [Tsukamurella soli]|uniref:hypothetical protein n=1 Tax=Tsukamurella soli TaxID=644556 RepID=UPI003619C9F8
MFTSAVIRRLARSEEMFADTHNFVGLGAHLSGVVDTDALAAAFDDLLAAHPVLAAQIVPVDGGGFEIVAHDLQHPGIDVFGPGDDAPPIFDQTQALVHLRVAEGGPADGTSAGTRATLYVHHSLADGHHQFALIEELFSRYTDLVAGGRGRAWRPRPRRHRSRRCWPSAGSPGSIAPVWSGSCPRCSRSTCRRRAARPLMPGHRSPSGCRWPPSP